MLISFRHEDLSMCKVLNGFELATYFIFTCHQIDEGSNIVSYTRTIPEFPFILATKKNKVKMELFLMFFKTSHMTYRLWKSLYIKFRGYYLYSSLSKYYGVTPCVVQILCKLCNYVLIIVQLPYGRSNNNICF